MAAQYMVQHSTDFLPFLTTDKGDMLDAGALMCGHTFLPGSMVWRRSVQ
jgi:hypothetical protein